MFGIGCQQTGVIETQNQSYYIARLVGDPNGRNVFRATTVWSEDTAFEMLIPNYWEVKLDTDDKYNTDIYISSNEYDDDSCVMLPGTVGYGVSADLEKEQWATLTGWGTADDWYFYETVDEVRRPVFRTAAFTDEDGNYYILEAQYPEENWEACNADVSNMIATFKTLDTKLEDTYIAEEIFQPKWIKIVFSLLETPETKFVVDYPPTWSVEDLGKNILADNENVCSVYAGVASRDLSEAASYDEDVLVLDNNAMAKKYTLYNGTGIEYMEIVSVEYNDLTYNFELHDVTADNKEICASNFEAIVQSFRTYEEEVGATSGYDVFDAENQDSGTGTAE